MKIVDQSCFNAVHDGWGTYVSVRCVPNAALKKALDDMAEEFLSVDSDGRLLTSLDFESELDDAFTPAGISVIPVQNGYEIMLDCRGPVGNEQGEVYRRLLKETLSRFPNAQGTATSAMPASQFQSSRDREDFGDLVREERVHDLDNGGPDLPTLALPDSLGFLYEDSGYLELRLKGEERLSSTPMRWTLSRYYRQLADPMEMIRTLTARQVALGWRLERGPWIERFTSAALLSYDKWLLGIEATLAEDISDPEFRRLRAEAPATILAVLAVKEPPE